jgi:hypothetical protein
VVPVELPFNIKAKYSFLYLLGSETDHCILLQLLAGHLLSFGTINFCFSEILGTMKLTSIYARHKITRARGSYLV